MFTLINEGGSELPKTADQSNEVPVPQINDETAKEQLEEVDVDKPSNVQIIVEQHPDDAPINVERVGAEGDKAMEVSLEEKSSKIVIFFLRIIF